MSSTRTGTGSGGGALTMRSFIFSHDEQETFLALVAQLTPESFPALRAKALIFKCADLSAEAEPVNVTWTKE